MTTDITKKFGVREDGTVSLTNFARKELINQVISPLTKIYGNPLAYDGAREILELEATVLLNQYERYMNRRN
jgi:hypothetical protein